MNTDGREFTVNQVWVVMLLIPKIPASPPNSESAYLPFASIRGWIPDEVALTYYEIVSKIAEQRWFPPRI